MTLRPPRALLCCLLLLACSCAHRGPAACSAVGELHLVSPGHLTAGVDLSNPPFGYTDVNGKATGFEVELVRAMAKAMELKLTLFSRSAPALIPAVLAHRLDVAAASFRDDAGLPNDVCTSGAYLDGDIAVLVRGADAQTLKDVDKLAGRQVVVIDDGAASRWAAAHVPSARLVAARTVEDAVAGVRNGRVDAAVLDRPLAIKAQHDAPELRVVAGIHLDAHFVLAGAPDTAIIAPVDTALQTLSDDGTLDALKKKWFGPGL